MTATIAKTSSPLEPPCVALCANCWIARRREPSPATLVHVPNAPIVSGTCHDCGGGWCECRGRLPCELCPRKNSPVIVLSLRLYTLVVPPPPDTVPSPLDSMPPSSRR